MVFYETEEPGDEVREAFRAVLRLKESDRPAFLAGLAGDVRSEVESSLEALLGSEGRAETRGLDAARLPGDVLVPGDVVGPYEVLEESKRGGMGAVYRARRHRDFSAEVAIKVVTMPRGDGIAREEFVARFHRERQLLATLKHKNIVRLLDGLTTERGDPCIVMEWVEGRTIDVYAQSVAELREVLHIFLQVCDAVQYAHGLTVVHRDLKPNNVLVDADGQVRLLDFGLAKMLDATSGPDDVARTTPDHRIGTPAYASPEQIRGEEPSVAMDVYALGVILFELLAGRRPFEVGSWSEADRLLNESAPRLIPSEVAGRVAWRSALRGDLDNIVHRAMHRDVTQRYPIVERLRRDVRAFLDDKPVDATPDSWRYTAGKFVRRHRVGVASTVGFVLTILVGIVVLSVALAQTADARSRATHAAHIAEGATATEQHLRGRALAGLGRFEEALTLFGATAASGHVANPIGLQVDRMRALASLGRLGEVFQEVRSLNLTLEGIRTNPGLLPDQRGGAAFLVLLKGIASRPVAKVCDELRQYVSSADIPSADRELILGFTAPTILDVKRHMTASFEADPVRPEVWAVLGGLSAMLGDDRLLDAVASMARRFAHGGLYVQLIEELQAIGSRSRTVSDGARVSDDAKPALVAFIASFFDSKRAASSRSLGILTGRSEVKAESGWDLLRSILPSVVRIQREAGDLWRGVPVLSWFQLPFMVDHLKHSITGTAGGESPVQRLNAVRSRAKALPIANFHYSLALELSEQNRWEEADRALRAALDAPALMDHTLHLRVRLNLVYVQRMLYPNRTWPGATRLVEEIIKDPAFDASVARYVSNNLSWCAHMPAYRHVTQAWLDLEPTSPQALDAYAYMLYKAGDYGGVVLTIDRIRPEAQLPAPQLDRIRGLRTKAVTHLGMIGPPFEARRLEELTEMNWIQDVGKLPKSVVATRVSAALDVVRNLRMTRQLSRASRLLKLVAKPAQQFEPRRWCREQYACLRDLGRTVEALQVAVEAMRKGGNDADRRELSRALANCGLYGKALRIGRPCVESGSTLSASQRESFRSSLAHLELAAHAQRHASTLPATMVWSIPRDSPAFALGFRPGDVVVAVGKEAVGDPASYFRIRARLGEGAEAMFRLRRGARELDPVKTQGPINMQVFKLRAVDPKGDAVDVTF